ncbi:hypothetical protein A2W54_02940 [Candidatus Giovannonibacteria bacterium RIFCSPHIGHO2_02_43_13]|uniref:Transglycosylase SLT domain-containing protein n=1 Tax=Candidatus Giovannonibacteria bacterium RIFCSPHIGHO2_02_43_13 TaxID=1798330 RepID=A0A1F5WPW3_9BACT|nr:MAG: hypothetical protein UW28_C0003G0047 [Parcubacteria group bacterium GW2011_GWA2_44_13]OGF72513.1 MAG: hypothetical protein A3E06_03890 [Candidatus Giovannonibacteria bacterium RIFCSPHIGHO2_12_FULL_44_42]OGF77698.1 MAG: hypothetical protein A2W54_02940 [Candidatus Giovannonibacteria bacterium RIFCSPHIGHO2_02_43_13]OGF88956.1 MAG: hypothetical protein A3I94_03550 [Candidatus Giovannonibacteria bacterium RIFCSPLOWO2_02_FULL_43_54]OGF97393.1 MAG: hypothetical protein A3H08_03900 [Candidatus
MNYLVFAAIAALLSIPRVAYEQQMSPSPAFPFPQRKEIQAIAKEPLPDVLTRIAACESQGRHFDGDGNVLVGERNKYDIGKFQINVLYWGDLAKKLGHDLYTEEGNEAVALAIYEKYGTAPWKWSKKCWNK